MLCICNCQRKLLKRDDLLKSIFSLIINLLQPTIKMVSYVEEFMSGSKREAFEALTISSVTTMQIIEI